MNGAAQQTDLSPERVYPYDHQLHDRRFLNCCQRHAVVFLAERNIPTDLLFFRALIPSDLIMTQILLENRPKYAITTDYFSPEDLALLGVAIHEHAAESFAAIRPLALAEIERTGFALLAGDVFHFPHCPEYRASHGAHVVVLRGYAGGVWSIVDDNHASILCEYDYQEQYVKNFFENNGARILRAVQLGQPAAAAPAIFAERFAALLASYQDSGKFYRQIETILENPLASAAFKYRALHDCFTVLSGTRNSLARYLHVSNAPPAAIAHAQAFAEACLVLKGLIVKAQLTGRLRPADVISRCASLRAREAELLETLRAALL